MKNNKRNCVIKNLEHVSTLQIHETRVNADHGGMAYNIGLQLVVVGLAPAQVKVRFSLRTCSSQTISWVPWGVVAEAASICRRQPMQWSWSLGVHVHL